jgi:hypothetical protein
VNDSAVKPDVAPRERYPGERLELANRIPCWSRRALLVGAGVDMLAAILRRAWNMPVCAVEFDAARRSSTGSFVENLIDTDALSAASPYPPGHFDVFVILNLSDGLSQWQSILAWARDSLDAKGAGLLLLHEAGPTPPLSFLCEFASDAGFAPYHTWTDPHLPTRSLTQFVMPGFDPIERAAQLASAGQPDTAYNELMTIPVEQLSDTVRLAAVHEQALHYLAEVAEASLPELGHSFLLRAQGHYFHTSRHCPESVVATAAYARLLRRAGAHALADDLCATFHTAYPMIEGFSGTHGVRSALPDAWSSRMDSNFRWPGAPARILFITHPEPHYGLDLLHDGLCRCLGPECVTEFPHKPSLHGITPHSLAHYPCAFDWPAGLGVTPNPLDLLRAGEFDLVLHGDSGGELPVAVVLPLLEAARTRGIPVIHVDAMDECMDYRATLTPALGGFAFDLYFKREMAEFMEYAPAAAPLPFSFSQSKVRPHDSLRSLPFFWAGVRQFGFRRLYLDHLEKRLDTRLDISYPPDAYAERMSSSLIGLSLHGKGFDTVRYWELPAHGCMLLAQRPPIHIPHNFVEGESAVFFDSLSDLEEKLAWYLEQPEECARIARAGELHYLAHHTSEARARQFLHFLHTHFMGSTP